MRCEIPLIAKTRESPRGLRPSAINIRHCDAVCIDSALGLECILFRWRGDSSSVMQSSSRVGVISLMPPIVHHENNTRPVLFGLEQLKHHQGELKLDSEDGKMKHICDMLPN
jgi:hypothetical protein